jgi:hypothetical protein
MFDAEEIANSLVPFTRRFYRLIEAAIYEAKAYFDEPERELSPTLFANLVRYITKSRWDQFVSQPHAIEDLLGFVRIELPNDGVAFQNTEFYLRCWKADEGSLPPPGHSQAKRQFFAQGSLTGTHWTQAAMSDVDPAWESPPPSNLVLLWDVDANHGLSVLALVCPEADSEGNYGEAWRIRLQHPAELEVPPSTEVLASELDLDFRRGDEELPEEGKATGQTG